MKKYNNTQILVLAVTLVTVLINILTNIMPLNGQTIAGISDQFKVFFVPAGYTFMIWGIIYIGLLVYAFYQLQPELIADQRLIKIAGLYLGSCLANVAWLFFWLYNLFALSLLAMVSLLILLTLIYQRLNSGVGNTAKIEKWVVDIPFKIYLGWIMVATIANVTDVLYYYQWDGFGMNPITWAQILLGLGILLAISVYLKHKDMAIPFVFIWAYIGIGVKFAENKQYSGSAWAMAFLIGFMMYALDLGKKIKAGSDITPPGLSENNRR